MQVGSASALNILRTTYSSDNLTTSTDSTSARLKILQNAARAQESLRESMATSAEAAKARAARKLEEAKQQLEMLKSGGYPPEVVARLAAELAHKISAAAAEFASAVAASATNIASTANASAATTDTGAASADAATDTSGTDAAAAADSSDTSAPKRTNPTAQLRRATPTRASSKTDSRRPQGSPPKTERRWKSSRPSCRRFVS